MPLSVLGTTLAVTDAPAGAAATTLYAAAGGSDTANSCSAATRPCGTVSLAVSVAAPGDTIDVAGTIDDHVTVPGALTSLTVTQWPGRAPAVLDGTGTGTVLTIAPGSTVTIDHLTVEGGKGTIGGGIDNTGVLTVTDSTISGNASTTRGGGIANSNTLAVTGSTISGNTATDRGGGIDDTGILTLTGSTVSGNTATALGGGISSLAGAMTVTDSTISGNRGALGGGIGATQTVTLTDSTVSGNGATQGGGIASDGRLTLTDSTVSGNSSGGIFSVDVEHVGASIVAANTGGNCSGTGTVDSAGYNLTDDATGTACGFTQPTDVTGLNPDLGPLQDNGGPTLTMAPAAGGAATGRIPLGTVVDGVSVCPGVDQRGVARPQPPGGATCTIGAVESAAPSITSPDAATFTVGSQGTFQVTASGYPASRFGETGSLPSGVSLSAAGLLAGTPGPGTAGTYPITLTAANGSIPGGSQQFTLTVVGPPGAPAITSATGGTGNLAVTWSPPRATGGLPLLYFVVEAVPASGPTITKFVGAPATTASLAGLSAGTTYTVTVTAGNAQGEGPASAPTAVTTVAAATKGATSTPGYWLTTPAGKVTAVGAAPFEGDVGNQALDAPIVGMAATPDHQGYWLVASDGGVFAFGDAHFYGSEGGRPLNAPVVGIAATPTGGGYWLVARDGGIFAFGNATFYGSMGGKPLNQPVVAMTARPTGGGYWLVARDGGVFTFGKAAFYGSMGGKQLNKPVIAMSPTSNGRGYWLVASDGGVFSFGNAAFSGSLGGQALTSPVVAAMFDPSGGYWLVSATGTAVPFGAPTLPPAPGNLTVGGSALFTA